MKESHCKKLINVYVGTAVYLAITNSHIGIQRYPECITDNRFPATRALSMNLGTEK